MGIKKTNAEFDAEFEVRWKSTKKVYTKKVIGLRIFVHRIERWKIHNSYTVMIITFFVGTFYNFINGFEISVNSAFFDISKSLEFFCGSYLHFFANLETKG